MSEKFEVQNIDIDRRLMKYLIGPDILPVKIHCGHLSCKICKYAEIIQMNVEIN